MGRSSRRRKHRHSSSDDDDDDGDDTDSSSSLSPSHKRRSRRKERNERSKRKRESKHRRSRKDRKKRGSESEDGSRSSTDDDSKPRRSRVEPKAVLRHILKKFPGVTTDLEQLLQMIDDGQAVDIKGLSERSLIKYLKKLFISLNLKEDGDEVFLLPPKVRPTLEVIGPMLRSNIEPKDEQLGHVPNEKLPLPPDVEGGQVMDENDLVVQCPKVEGSPPKRRMIGPEMPSAELLAAAAKLTEAEAELREVDLDEDSEIFIGPPPPAMVAEAASANEAERFEEVTRIMGVETDSPYDVLGVNLKMSVDNVKKRYWKLSLLVHPDKCPHPQAHQAFVKLNKAFKDLQDPDKRKALDEKIKQKEEQEAFKAELKAMREAAQWRRLQGISMEGDDELLADMEVKVEPKRDEWMTTLPPERKAGGVTMQSTKFSKRGKEGRGDTSVWTDTPSDRAQKAKINYLEAYNEAAAIASNEVEKKRTSSDADLVDKYNKAKRSKSLMQKHQEEASGSSERSKRKKAKQQAMAKKVEKEKEEEEWVGKHPWKPWDREQDLTAGRQSVKLDEDNMAQGLSSRFSSGNFQRNFL